MISINLHGATAVRAKFQQRGDTYWVDLNFKCFSQWQEITLFCQSAEFAQNLADAINEMNDRERDVGDLLTEAGITDEVPSPVEGVRMFQFKPPQED